MYKHNIYLALFLTVLVITVALNFTPIVRITLLSDAPKETSYELFYAKPIPYLYGAEQKISGKIKKCKGKSAGQLKFTLPFGTPMERFRLDFGNQKGCKFTIYRIEVSSHTGLFRKILDSDNFGHVQMANQIKKIAQDKNYVTLQSTGNDPFAIIDMGIPGSMHWSLSGFLLFLFLVITLLPLIFHEKADNLVDSAAAAIVKYLKRITGLYSRISPYYLLTLIFLAAFLMGLTGSSIGLIRNGGISEPVGEKKLFGKYRSIRTDEINAHGTASAIQSYKNNPRFQLINKNIGISGRNFLFLHDWGAPVKHAAMLIRPSNWMFFLTGLRHALSWYWLFPIFFGIISLLFFLDTLFGKDPWLHFIASAGLVFSPYCACWSFWPINCSAGTFLAAAALIRLFQSRRIIAMFGWALLAGWGFSVSAATLYFPHIWPCVTLVIVVAAGKITVSRHENRGLPLWKAIAFLIFLLTAGTLLYIFFDAIREPLSLAMKSDAGNRIRNGGLFQAWELFRGWLFPVTFYHEVYMNQCEAQAYQFLLIPLLFLFQRKYHQLESHTICWILLIFLVYTSVYQFIGLPSLVTKLTGWNHCTEPRVCFAVQIAQVMLLVALAHVPEQKNSWQHCSIAILGALMLTVLAALCLYWIPESFKNSIPKLGYYQAFMFLLVSILLFFISNTVILYNPRWGTVVFALVTGIPGFIFNPVCIAPSDIKSPIVEEIKTSSGLKNDGRILLVGNTLSSAHQQQFVMAGGKVFNGFFCYEDVAIFDLLLKNLPHSNAFHRLNHMSVVLTSDNKIFSADIPQGDCIRLRMNGAKFDFSKLPIDFVVNWRYNGNNGLDKNPTLYYYKDCGLWQLWRVKTRSDSF